MDKIGGVNKASGKGILSRIMAIFGGKSISAAKEEDKTMGNCKVGEYLPSQDASVLNKGADDDDWTFVGQNDLSSSSDSTVNEIKKQIENFCKEKKIDISSLSSAKRNEEYQKMAMKSTEVLSSIALISGKVKSLCDEKGRTAENVNSFSKMLHSLPQQHKAVFLSEFAIEELEKALTADDISSDDEINRIIGDVKEGKYTLFN